LLVPRCPDQKLQKYRREIDPFLSQAVIKPSPIRIFDFSRDDPCRFELPQTVGKDIGRNAFSGLLKLSKRTHSADHQIANYQKRPAVSERFERDTYRAAGAPC
jgi:hypothetical protein